MMILRSRNTGLMALLASLFVAAAAELGAEVGEKKKVQEPAAAAIDVEAELETLDAAPAEKAAVEPPKEAAPPAAPRRSGPGTVRTLEVSRETARLRVFAESGSLFSRGVDAHRRGDLALAASRYREALEIDAGFVEAMVNLARVLGEQGDRPAAEDWLDRARGEAPAYPGVSAARGWLALRHGELGRAIEHLEEAQRLAPRDVDVLVNLGVALTLHGRLHHAHKVLQAAEQRAPEDDRVVLNLAVVDDRAGRTPAALHGYRRYLEISAQGDPMRADVERRLTELGAEAPPTNPGVGAAPAPRRWNPFSNGEETER